MHASGIIPRMAIPRVWEPVLIAPLFSVVFVYFSSAIVGYARGGESLPPWVRHFVGWSLGDDRVTGAAATRIAAVGFFTIFAAIAEWVVFGISLREQLAVDNWAGVVFLLAHGAFVIGWTAYLARWSSKQHLPT